MVSRPLSTDVSFAYARDTMTMMEKQVGRTIPGGLRREVLVSGPEREAQMGFVATTLAYVRVNEDDRGENMTADYARVLGKLLILAADEAESANAPRRENDLVGRTA